MQKRIELRGQVLRFFVALLLFAMFGSSSRASDEARWYVGVTAGPSSHHEVCSKAATTFAVASCDDESVAVQVFGGRGFGNGWAAEIAYIDAGEATVNGNGGTMTVSPRLLSASAVYNLDVGRRLSLFFKAGVVAYNTEVHYSGGLAAATGFAMRQQTGIEQAIGGGLEWNVLRNVNLRLEYGHFNVNDVEFGDLDLLTAGVRLDF